jgi:hypothetical protein
MKHFLLPEGMQFHVQACLSGHQQGLLCLPILAKQWVRLRRAPTSAPTPGPDRSFEDFIRPIKSVNFKIAMHAAEHCGKPNYLDLSCAFRASRHLAQLVLLTLSLCL